MFDVHLYDPDAALRDLLTLGVEKGADSTKRRKSENRIKVFIVEFRINLTRGPAAVVRPGRFTRLPRSDLWYIHTTFAND